MARLKTYWRAVSALAALLVLSGAFVWRSVGHRTALAWQEPPPLSQTDHDAIINALEHASLDRDALVALNLSSQQAQEVLTEVRNWWDTNKSTLATRQRTIWEKANAVRDLREAIALGPFEAGREAALATAISDLATARATYDDTFDSLRTEVNALLSASQQITWTAIQSGFGQRMPLRMLSLTDQQRIDLSRAVRRHRYAYGAASNASARSSANSAYASELDGILTQAQEDVLSAYDSNYATASQTVAGAFATVLAVEES